MCLLLCYVPLSEKIKNIFKMKFPYYKYTIAITLLIMQLATLEAQDTRIQSTEFLYWQEGVSIEFEDFQRKDIDQRGYELMEKYSLI